ncbi:MAG: GWxTD domain-containing protein [Candidatus Eisenbacteria sp.]|nr:GWxTD domain-containing protein [Candidatus Eisenbacteria bacterium]
MRRSVIALLICLGLPLVGAAEGIAGSRHCPKATSERLPLRVATFPRFEADLSYFALDAEIYRLEAWISVLNDDLQFVKREGRYLARYEITVIANDGGGTQVRGDQMRKRRWVDTYEATNRTETVVLDLVTLKLPHGAYDIAIRICDLDSGVESSGQQRVVLPKGGDTPWLSSLKFLVGTLERGESFDSSGVEVRRSYGDSLPVMRAYVELYGAGNAAPPVELIYEMEDPERDRVAVGRGRSLGAGGFGRPYLIEVPTDSISIGIYDLKVTARVSGEAVATMCGSFRVASSKSLWVRDFDAMLDLLSYIATSEEMDKLKEVSLEDRREAWEEFWAGRDITPETGRNETRDEFFTRVAYANRHFGQMLIEGWQTDRGRIYITEGPPDNIESHPMSMSGNAWEVWHYQRRGIIYIFEDRNGFGEYVLTGIR